MITIKELIRGVSKAKPEFIVEREGRKSQINIYTQDKNLGKLGVGVAFNKDVLRRSDTTVCPKLAELVAGAFNNFIKEN